MKQNTKTKELVPTPERYDAMLDDFIEKRGRVAELYAESLRRGQLKRAQRLYDLWRQLVARQHEYFRTHPTAHVW